MFATFREGLAGRHVAVRSLLPGARRARGSPRPEAAGKGEDTKAAMSAMAADSLLMEDLLQQTPTIGGTLQRAVQISTLDGFKKFLANTKLVTDKVKPRPGPGEVLVRMRLRPVHPADGLSLMGLYPGFKPSTLPATPGLEGMGLVDTLGPGVEEFKVGQRVVPLLSSYTREGEGSWQEYCNVAAEDLAAIPDGVSDEAAAQLVVNPITAYGLLKALSPPSGQYILQTAAGSILGRLVIALAKEEGIRTINVVRRREQVEELQALGGTEVLCSTTDDIVERVKEITGGQLAWGGIDTVAGATTKLVASAVRDGGSIFLVGGFSSPDCSLAIADLIFRDVAVKGWWLSRYLGEMSASERNSLMAEMMRLLATRVIDPLPGEKVDLADFASALQKQRESGRPGKVLLTG